MPGTAHGSSIKNPRVYDALRRKGYAKDRAAAISNAIVKAGGYGAGYLALMLGPVAKAAERDYTRDDTGRFSESSGGGGGKKDAPKKPKKDKPTPEEKAEAKKEEQATNRADVAEATGLDASAMEALDEFASPDEVIALSDANREKLTAAGLVEQGPNGEDRMTAAGRAYLAAAERGDQRAAADAMSRGKEQAGRKAERQAKVEERAKAKAEKEQAKANAAAEKDKKKGGGGGGGGKGGDEPDKATAEAAKREQATALAAERSGYSPAAVAALRGAADGGSLDGKAAAALTRAGLIEETPDGPQLTGAGRKALAALDKGDARAALAARQDAARAVRQAGARAAQAGERQAARDAKTKAREDERATRERASADKERQAGEARSARAQRQDKSVTPFRRAATPYGLGVYSLRKRGVSLTKRSTSTHAVHGYAPIAKVDDGERLVFGIASTAVVDDQPGVWRGQRYDGDIVDSDAMREALTAYWGNIRAMHDDAPIAAGRALDVLPGEDGRTYLVAKVIDDDAWRKVRDHVYKGFSIGGQALKARLERLADGRVVRRILKLLLTEISLVDRPANPEAAILVYKRHPHGGTMAENETEAPQADAVEGADALAALANVAGDDDAIVKAAGDPMKVIAQIQALRNEAELAGDLEAAERYTQAIGLLLVASGEASEPEDMDADLAETEEEIGADLEDVAAGVADEDAAKAARASVRKAGRKISAERMAIFKQALMTYAKALADAGDEDAVKMLEALAGTAAMDGEALKVALGDLRKSLADDVQQAATEPLQTIARAILKMHDQMQGVVADVAIIKAQPAGGGPVTRFNGQPVTKRLGEASATQAVHQVSDADRAELARLQRLATLETNTTTRQQYLDEIAEIKKRLA